MELWPGLLAGDVGRHEQSNTRVRRFLLPPVPVVTNHIFRLQKGQGRVEKLLPNYLTNIYIYPYLLRKTIIFRLGILVRRG